MAELGSRIRQVLGEKGLTQSQLARMVNVKQQTISYICAPDSPATASRYAPAIAQALGVNPNWLQSGEGDKYDPTVRIELGGVAINVDRVPLLSTRDVKAYLDGKEVDRHRALMTDVGVGAIAFAIEIHGECMSPTFHPGDRVIIDPDLTAVPGDYVLAAVGSDVVFRKYRLREGGLFELMPLNDDWPSVRSDGKQEVKILGVMAEHRSYRERR